jgi:zona occludens toxin (predicted ATPase)
MQKNKKIFLFLFVLFMLIILYVSYDISSRTTFPGSKGNLKERISTEVQK